MIWYAFYDLRSGNRVGPILTAPKHTRANPKNVAFSYNVGKISAGYLVSLFIICTQCLKNRTPETSYYHFEKIILKRVKIVHTTCI